MSYIAFDLDALNVVPDVASASGLSPGDVAHGLLKLWAWCFRGKTDVVTTTHLAGFFGGRDAAPALHAFGFLEPRDGAWRVKGATRYLRISEARSKGGKKASGNLKRGTKKPGGQPGPQPGVEPGASREVAGGPAGSEPRLIPGSTPNTEHRAPNVETSAPAAPRRNSDLLCEDFKAATGSAYLWQGGKDGDALAALLRVATIEEVRTRWRRGLSAGPEDWLSCRTVAQLRQKWNDLAGGKDAPRPNPEHRPLRHLG